MATIADGKVLLEKPDGLFLFEVTFRDGTVVRIAKQAVTWGGNDYDALVLSHSPMTVEAGSQGVDAVLDISLTLNNADSNLNSVWTSAQMRGGTIQPRFVFVDPRTNVATTDSFPLPIFVMGTPEKLFPELTFSAHNKMMLARKEIPVSRITRRDRYPFPDTAAERLAAGSDPKSPFFALGYDPANGKGNYKTGSTPYVRSEYNGLRDQDGPSPQVSLKTIGLEARFGGFGKVPETINFTPSKKKVEQFVGDGNEAKYGQVVPLLYGTVRVRPIVLDTGGPPAWNGARLSHMLLSDALTFDSSDGAAGIDSVLRVWLPSVNDGQVRNKYQEIPLDTTTSDPHTTGSYSVVTGGFKPYRNIVPASDYAGAGDFPDRDLYSGLAILNVGIPKEFAGHEGLGPEVQAVVKGLKVEQWDVNGNSIAYSWSDNPIWIYIDVLRRAGWNPSTEMNLVSAYKAAAICDATVTNGDGISAKRFRCNLAIVQGQKLGDVLRVIRNTCRLDVGYGADGKLEFRVRGTVAQDAAQGGGLAFTIDSTKIARDADDKPMVERWTRRPSDIPNVFVAQFQNEAARSTNGYQVYPQDALRVADVDEVNDTGEQLTSESLLPLDIDGTGLPSYDQAYRVLSNARSEIVDLNDFVTVWCTTEMLGIRPGQLGTITEDRHSLSSQQVRCKKVSIDENAGLIEIVLQRHSDGAYSDDSVPTPITRAQNDTTFTPRSVGSPSGYTGNPTLAEHFIQDDVDPDKYHRQIRVAFSVPPTTYENSFRSQCRISNLVVQTTGGSIPGNQVKEIEVCPTLDGAQGLATSPLRANIPAGTDTNRITLDIALPIGANGYIIRGGDKPGRLYKIKSGSGTGGTTVSVSITENPNTWDASSLSPDPGFHHAHVFYYFDGAPNMIYDAGSTSGPTETEFFFDPKVPGEDDTSIIVVVSGATVDEKDFYPFDHAPRATASLTLDTGNPSGAANLSVVSNATDPRVPKGSLVFKFDRDTVNYKSIENVMLVLSTGNPSAIPPIADLPGEGPYQAERDAAAGGFIIESGVCTIAAGSRTVQVTRSSNSAAVDRVLLVYTDDASDDSDLDGEVIETQGTNSLTLTRPFQKGGDFSYVIVRRWWEIGASGEDMAPTTFKNRFSHTWTIQEILNWSGDINSPTWKTPPIAIPTGTYAATLYSRNKFGVGTRITSNSFSFNEAVGLVDVVAPGALQGLYMGHSGGGWFRAKWSDPATGNNTLVNVWEQYSKDPDFVADVTTLCWRYDNQLEGQQANDEFYFRFAAQNRSGLNNNASASFLNGLGLTAVVDGIGPWTTWNLGGGPELVQSGVLAIETLIRSDDEIMVARPRLKVVGGMLFDDETNNQTILAVTGGGSVTGPPLGAVAGQVTFWTGAATIGGDDSLWWDNVDKNLGIGTFNQFGSGQGVIGIQHAATNPTTNPANGGVLYADGSDGMLKWRTSAGATHHMITTGPQNISGVKTFVSDVLTTARYTLTRSSGTLFGRIGTTLTSNRDWTFPDATGLIALANTPGGSGAVPNWDSVGTLHIPIMDSSGTVAAGLLTSNPQGIPGTKTFTGTTFFTGPLVGVIPSGNVGFFTTTEFGGGSGVIGIANATTLPTTNSLTGGILYSQGGLLKWRRTDGTIDTFGVGGSGITTLNTLTNAVQFFATGTTGTDFNIASSGSNHTFNIPDAGATPGTRGFVSAGIQEFYGLKTFNAAVITRGTFILVRTFPTTVQGSLTCNLTTAARTWSLPDASGGLALTTAPGIAGSDVNWTTTGQLNVPDATSSNRGMVSTGGQSYAGLKHFLDGMDSSQSTRIAGNLSVGSLSPSYGGGAGVVYIRDAATNPSSNPANGGVLYSDGGVLKWRRSNGIVDQVGGGSGITTLNGLTSSAQSLVVGSGGSDFNISSSGTSHTFNIPDAGSAARGLVSTGPQTFNGDKTFVGSVHAQGSVTFRGGAGGFAVILATSPMTADRVFTFPDTSGVVVVTTGAQTIAGIKRFSSRLDHESGIGFQDPGGSRGDLLRPATMTSGWTWRLPDSGGTLALTTTPGGTGSDVNWSSNGTLNIPSMTSTGVTRGLLTNGSQVIPGTKSFTGQVNLLATGGAYTLVSGGNFGVGLGAFAGGDNVIGVGNASAAPNSNPSGGGILYADGGAGKWRGSSGTVTTFGPAEPHCPDCGRDFALEWESDRFGYLAICAWCLTEDMPRGVIARRPSPS